MVDGLAGHGVGSARQTRHRRHWGSRPDRQHPRARGRAPHATHMTDIRALGISNELRDRLVELRRSIHREPELAFEEERTAEKLERALAKLGVADVRRVAGTAV